LPENIRRLRNPDPKVPIIMVSGIDRTAKARAAEATAFLHSDEWLRIGSVVEQQLRRATDSPASDETAVA
jgi:hypothetical protein